MAERLTDEQVRELRGAATPGPWEDRHEPQGSRVFFRGAENAQTERELAIAKAVRVHTYADVDRRPTLPLGFAVREWSETVPDDAHDKLKGRPLLVSVSGGKDSTVLAHWILNYLRPAGEVHLVHADTGWEHADTDAYVREVLPEVLGLPIRVVRSIPDLDGEALDVARQAEALMGRTTPSAYVRWIAKKAMFSSRAAKWCTQYLKVAPIHDYMRDALDGRCVNVVGVRAAESARRATMGEWDMDGGAHGLVYPVWRPLIAWSEGMVIDYHRDHDLPANPLYHRGARRVGCFPCIASRKHEIAYVDRVDPGRVTALRLLESYATDKATARAAENGRPVVYPDGTPIFRAFFQNPEYRRHAREAEARGDDPNKVVNAQARIDDVIAWAHSDGPEAEVDAWEQGCVRWGFCELPALPIDHEADERVEAYMATHAPLGALRPVDEAPRACLARPSAACVCLTFAAGWCSAPADR